MFNLILLAFLLALLIFVGIFWIFQISYTFSNDKIGFLPTLSGKLNMQLFRIFEEYLHDPSQYSFVELGAGVANIAGMISKRFNFKEVVAVEIDPITVFFGKLINTFGGTTVNFIQKNIFDYDIPEGSVLYCYLGTHIMEKLYHAGKLDGHLVISTTFKLKEVEPVEVIEMNNFYLRMYVYDFRKKKVTKKVETAKKKLAAKKEVKSKAKTTTKNKKVKTTKSKTTKKKATSKSLKK